MKRSFASKCFILLVVIFLLTQIPAFALIDSSDTARFAGGFQRVLLSAFQLPFQVVNQTLNGPIGVGTVYGAVTGTVRTVSDMVGGTFDMAAAAAPYAKYAALAL